MARLVEVPFPDTLYVSRSYGSENEAPFEGYSESETAEEDDEVAVYQLVRVCKVKVRHEKYLEELRKCNG